MYEIETKSHKFFKPETLTPFHECAHKKYTQSILKKGTITHKSNPNKKKENP